MLLNYSAGLVLLFSILVTSSAAVIQRNGSSVDPTMDNQTQWIQQRFNSTVDPTMVDQPDVPESQTPCQRLQSAGIAVFRPANELTNLDGYDLITRIPSEEEVLALLCRIADAENLDELTTTMEPFPFSIDPLTPATRDLVQFIYIFFTDAYERFFGGLDHMQERVNFVQAFVDFVRDNNLGKQPVSYETAHAFTTRLVEDFGENFLRTLAKLLSGMEAITSRVTRHPIDENDVIQADKLALALSGSLMYPLAFAETSKLSVTTSETVLWVTQKATDPMANEAYQLLKQLIAAQFVFLRTADDLGLLDLSVLVTSSAAVIPRNGSSVDPTMDNQTEWIEPRFVSTVEPVMVDQPDVPESQTRCQRLQSAGMAVYHPANELNDLFGRASRLIPPEEEVSALLCRIAVVENLDELTTAMEPLPGTPKPLTPSMRDSVQLVYIFATGLSERFFGGLDHMEKRVNFVQAFVDFVRDNNIGHQPVSHETAHAFTTRLVEEFGENFLKTLAKGLTGTESLFRSRDQSINETDVIQAGELASALSGPLTDPLLFAETSKLSVTTSETVLWVIEKATHPTVDEAYPLLKQLIAAHFAFLRTADDLGLLDLRV